MKTKQYFLSTLSSLLLLVAAQGSSAHILFTYQTAEMTWMGEKAQLQDGTPIGMDFLYPYTFQFDISFITPDLDFDLEEMEVMYETFDNPVVSVSPSGMFQSFTVERSSFQIEAYKYEGNIYPEWLLTFDLIDNNSPDGLSLQASITSRGNWDYMTLSVDNFHYSRPMIDVVVDIDAEFYGEFNGQHPDEYPGGIPRLFAKQISVPEPLTPALLLTGLLGLFAARKIKSKTHS